MNPETTPNVQSRKVPQSTNPNDAFACLQQLDEIVRILRTDCPWDKVQTTQSLAPMLIEEAYETVEAIHDSNDAELQKELGDILLHIIMHAVIAEERQSFSLLDIVQSITNKLIARHPHVFGDAVNVTAQTPEQVKKQWENLKQKEGRTSVLEGIPKLLPALQQSQRLQEKAASVGFDWDNREDVWKKLYEEIDEVRHEITMNNTELVRGEFGDVFFALVNVARFEGIHAEEALKITNKKFLHRFEFIEDYASKNSLSLEVMTLQEMDRIWDLAKKQGL